MKKETYFTTVAVVFVVVAALHFLRIISDWSVRIGAWDIPMWVSWLAVIIAGTLAYHGFRFKK
ncbi:MAG: hypothetical protein A2648_02095 [Candidatus Lloydbacteria bacterium RIFCSPHIGHO2_01_FULL_41_20]|uniref:Uncharacterized protein n=1 Tax=Candidatus Lloydbacteria bacterium RIFCSPHIGHO2_01_FULL_41_20 TaxID=1798657 RepID=A0A1G2CQR5_9BACT|nr:MAG: hypothetical protein A2648_02095 [Candidatus Lloydbacteria bacterium RIFCSPHIGHO2_01_FULL_41_20]